MNIAKEAQQPKNSIVSCGIAHTLVLTTTGQFLAWGCGKYGQLGYGDLWDREEPVVGQPVGQHGGPVDARKSAGREVQDGSRNHRNTQLDLAGTRLARAGQSRLGRIWSKEVEGPRTDLSDK